MGERHDCVGECVSEPLHKCNLKIHRCYQGHTIDECYEDERDGSLWAYSAKWLCETRVNFCPRCGYKAKVPSPEDSEDESLPKHEVKT